MDIDTTQQQDKPKPPSFNKLLVDLAFSIIIPVLILRKFSGEDNLGPLLALIVALSFPLMLAIYEFIKERKIGFVPCLGFISVLFTGGVAVLELPKEYIIIKEALLPLLIGLAVVFSIFIKKPFIKTMIHNDMFVRTDLVDAKLEELNKQSEFEGLMVKATWILASSFLVSSILNYVLAKFLLISEPGTEAFNQEFSTLTLWSYPLIAIPSTIVTLFAVFYAARQVLKMTGYTLEDIIREVE